MTAATTLPRALGGERPVLRHMRFRPPGGGPGARPRSKTGCCGFLAAAVFATTLCAPAAPPPDDLEEILGRFRQAFERVDTNSLDGLYPSGWALVAFAGETRRSATGEELRRGLERLFRNRSPIRYAERPRSILRSADGGYVLFVPEWTSMATGTDRYVVEAFRIGLERVSPASGPGPPSWEIREFTVWTR